MRRSPFLLLLLCLSCSTPPSPPTMRVSALFETLSVKSSAGDDSAIASLDLLVFRDGQLDAHARALHSAAVEASVTAGVPLRWYVLANAPEGMGQLQSESAFLHSAMELTKGPLAMKASGQDLFQGSENHVAGILLNRYACKISVDALEVSWLEAFDRPPLCSLEQMGLLHARRRIPWSGEAEGAADGDWEDRMDICEKAIPGPAPVRLDTQLYTLPNASEDQPTCLAIALRIDGVLQWYVTPLPELHANTHYRIFRILLPGPGNALPQMDSQRCNMELLVQVEPWENKQAYIQFPNV